jgi:hypothetical protein
MKHRRSIRSQLERRLRGRQPEAEALWETFRREAVEAGASIELVGRLERSMTWALWGIALHEASDAVEEIAAEEPEPHMAPPWLCQSCKRRILRVVGRDGDGLPATG